MQKRAQEITWDVTSAEKGGYKHFMLKEIMEQPQALRETMRGRLSDGGQKINLAELNFKAQEIENISKIFIIACGTAYHAGLVGKYLMENTAPAGRSRRRLRISLPRSPAVRKNLSHCHQPVRRNGRHLGRPAAGPGKGPTGTGYY